MCKQHVKKKKKKPTESQRCSWKWLTFSHSITTTVISCMGVSSIFSAGCAPLCHTDKSLPAASVTQIRNMLTNSSARGLSFSASIEWSFLHRAINHYVRDLVTRCELLWALSPVFTVWKLVYAAMIYCSPLLRNVFIWAMFLNCVKSYYHTAILQPC